MVIDLRELLTLSTIPGIGSRRLINLISHFKDTRLAVTASAKELIRVDGIEKKTALAIVGFFRNSGYEHAKRFIDTQFSLLNKKEARIVTYWDKEFPPNLKHTYDPPAFLFVRGTLAESDRYSIAVVGTRQPSPYGLHMAEQISQGLAGFGITTVSGLARGIDTAAHASTLKERGRTIAVVGSGVDIVYPAENKSLVERIADTGAVISEYYMGTKPDAPNFPRRNRIISGMSLGTIVVETGIEGGAMLTASLAFDQNRDVFAIPADVSTKRRSGTNLLIKQGKAMLIECVDDIVAALAPQLKNLAGRTKGIKTEAPPQLSMFEQKVYDAIGESPVHIDALAERAGCSTSDALVHLLSLEFKGAVRQQPGKMFVKTA